MTLVLFQMLRNKVRSQGFSMEIEFAQLFQTTLKALY